MTDEMVEAAAKAMILEMFAPHELPVDDELWKKYRTTARAALKAALAIGPAPDREAVIEAMAVRTWRCEITGNPVGTDTRMVWQDECGCQGCTGHRLAAAIRALATRPAPDREAVISANDLHYLRSIYRQLKEVKEALADTKAFSLGGMACADNLDWLECFCDKWERALAASPAPKGEHKVGKYYADYSELTPEEIAGNDWQPIETAPKDGRFIWLGAPGHARIGYWFVVTKNPDQEHWADMALAESGGPSDLLFAPTVWQQLPDPPALSEAQGKGE